MTTPETVYTNDPDVIRSFLARQGGRAVYKPLHGIAWRDGETFWSPFTNVLTERELVADHLLRAAPGIYQELLPKSHELRVTVFGERAFGARILSQDTQTGRLDWRRSYHDLRIEPCEIPAELERQCRAVLGRLGLVFGCFDFVITPDGRAVFLEVNESGQFLFIERYAGIPLLDAFAELLLQGDPAFCWDASKVVVRYCELTEAIHCMNAEQSRLHRPSPERAVLERDLGDRVEQDTVRV